MFKTSFRLVIYTISVLIFGCLFLNPIKMISVNSLQANARAQSLIPKSDTGSSTSGISIRILSLDQKGGVWLGGSVWGIEGLLLKSKSQSTKALTIDSVEYIRDLSFPTPQTGWMIADGLLYQTRDGGQSWSQVQTVGLTSHLKSVSFADRFVGWVSGQDGLILHTRDGGLTWNKQKSGTDFTINRIRFVSKDSGWAVGSNISPPETQKILLLTRDSGRTWRKAPESDAQQFSSVMFMNPWQGWAVNSKNEIVRTINGGASWNISRTADSSNWEAIFFVSKTRGWAVGDGIIHTTNGGKTWEYQLRINESTVDSLDDVIFTDAKSGWAIGLTKILRTNDGGATWKTLSNTWEADVIKYVRRKKLNQS